MPGVIKIADHVTLSGVNSVWISPLVYVGPVPLSQVSFVSHVIAGASANAAVQPMTTDDPQDDTVALGSVSNVTTATTTRIIRIQTTNAFGGYIQVVVTLSAGTNPTVTFSAYVYAYPAS